MDPTTDNQPIPIGNCLTDYKSYLAAERERAKEMHDSGADGSTVMRVLCQGMDRLLQCLYSHAVDKHPEMAKIAIVANGGYGRSGLSPGSDIDILFLTPMSSGSLSKGLKEGIDNLLYPLWDLNLKVGHAVRSTNENIKEAKKEPMSRTTLLDSRLVVGNEPLFLKFKSKFLTEAIHNDKNNFFAERSVDMEARYDRYSRTIYLQEPNVKESPGGLRDWHNLLWISETALQNRDIKVMQEEGVVSETGATQIQDSVNFLERLRNEMHFRTGKPVDILSLRLQGEVAEAFDYEGEDILIKIEKLMKDYYTHARNLNRRVRGIFELHSIEMEYFKDQSKTSWFPWGNNTKDEKKDFDGFYGLNGILYAQKDDIFTEKPVRLVRAFWHCQNHALGLSPTLRRRIKEHLHLVDDDFRKLEKTRNAIESIFGKRGQVGITLRAMHRVGILGLLFPEFGGLDCLVQHEFFHRYTADEHTLRCIDWLDRITTWEHPEDKLYGELFQKMEDPFTLYLALLLHDTGRALNTDDHVDGSSLYAKQVCDRLNITGERRSLIFFLVDHHLTFFRTATKKDIDDPVVIREFCEQIKTRDRLATLLVFTYCDSNATNPEGWTGWKELAITNLFKRADERLKMSKEEAVNFFQELQAEQLTELKSTLDEEYQPTLLTHFEEMPDAYFRYRETKSIRKHIKAIKQYENRRKRRPNTPFEAALQWREYENLGHSEVCLVAQDSPNLLASICCAMASYKINILSANVHTRADGLVLDIFHVCDENQQAVMDKVLQMRIVATIYKLNQESTYDPTKFIKEKTTIFDQKPAIKIVPLVTISNNEDKQYTTIEVQATDRLGLLHDLLTLFAVLDLVTLGAQINTERKTAINTFSLSNKDGSRISADQEAILYDRITEVA